MLVAELYKIKVKKVTFVDFGGGDPPPLVVNVMFPLSGVSGCKTNLEMLVGKLKGNVYGL